MSSDLERLLRDSREALPAPDDSATERARARSVAAVRRRRASPRSRILALSGAMLVTAVLLGVTASSLNAPSVTAAREPTTLGFVPEPGWFALQSPPPAVQGQQVVAVASNVPFAPDDVDRGFVEPSGLPYSTLLELPANGIVLVAALTPDTPQHRAPVRVNPYYPDAELPLSFRDAQPFIQWGAQVRPDQPLANYQLRAQLGEHNVDVMFYFGTPSPSDAARAAAQRQLAGLVMRKQTIPAAVVAHPTEGSMPTAIIDRTYDCRTVQVGGLYQIESRTHAGLRDGSAWARLPYAVVATGGVAKTPFVDSAPDNSVAWITAGVPLATSRVDEEWLSFTARAGGTVGVNHSLCVPSTRSVDLSARPLRGGAVGTNTAEFDCGAPRTVLVRIRAIVRGGTALRDRARLFRATNAPATFARLAVQTPTGRPLIYAEVSESGKARLFTAKGCTLQ